jgi:hypothetical protein
MAGQFQNGTSLKIWDELLSKIMSQIHAADFEIRHISLPFFITYSDSSEGFVYQQQQHCANQMPSKNEINTYNDIAK